MENRISELSPGTYYNTEKSCLLENQHEIYFFIHCEYVVNDAKLDATEMPVQLYKNKERKKKH